MKKGVDYDEVFAPSPNQNTARALCAMTVAMGLQRMAWDIKLAYWWADLPDNRLVALKYPKGYERTQDIPGTNGETEPEYIILPLAQLCLHVGTPPSQQHRGAVS